MGSKSRPPCVFTVAISASGSRTISSSPKIPQNMLPLTKAESWPNIGFRVTAGSLGTSLRDAALAPALGLGTALALGADITPILLLREDEIKDQSHGR